MELGKARVFFFMAFMCGGYRALYCLKRGIQLALGIFASLCVRGSHLACGRGKGLGAKYGFSVKLSGNEGFGV